MRVVLYLLVSILSLALEVPFVHGKYSSLVVELKTGTFQGTRSDTNGTDRWLGIPYAQPPVGKLRFKAPVPLTKAVHGIQNASYFKNACPQPAGLLGAPVSEDCLGLNVWRPIGTQPNAKLPILVWIFGGAYNIGASSEPKYDPTRIVAQSAIIGKPTIVVSFNYRSNAFGFLASSHVAPEDLNAGLSDQRLALQFIHDNIAAFGGDPTKVTIWGQSAGAGSVQTHVLYPPSKPLFRAAIACSSTGPFKSSPYSYQYDEEGMPFHHLTEAIGCPLGPESISCLQKVPLETLMNKTNEMIKSALMYQAWEPAVGPKGSFIPERPSERIASGKFSHIPYLGGTNLNEGTLFSKSFLSTNHTGTDDEIFDQFVGKLVLDNSTLTTDVLTEIKKMYPANDSSEGGPYHTGNSLFDRTAAWYTDAIFLAPRRLFFNKAADLQPLYAFYFSEFIPGNDITLGVAHASEAQLLYGPVPEVEEEFANQFLEFFITFVHDLKPSASWPRFTTSEKEVMQLKRDNNTLIKDDFAVDKTTYFNSANLLNEFEK